MAKRGTTAVSPRSAPEPKRLRVQTTANFIDSISDADARKIDELLANLVFRTGIAFRVVDSDAMKQSVTALRPAYATGMLSARAVAGKFLRRKYRSLMDRLLSVVENATWYTIVTDGWSNDKNEHFVNYIIIVPGYKPIFSSASVPAAPPPPQTGENVAADLLKIIERFGPTKCLTVLADDAPNMQRAAELIEQQHPTIFANGCTAHVMNLLVKDICAIPAFTTVLEDLQKVVKFVNFHKLARAEFKRLRLVMQIAHKLSLPFPTRWYTHYNACNDLNNARLAVCTLAESASSEKLDQIKNKSAVNEFRRIVKRRSFWGKLSKLTRLLSFSSKLIGKLESDSGDLFQTQMFRRMSGICSSNR